MGVLAALALAGCAKEGAPPGVPTAAPSTAEAGRTPSASGPTGPSFTPVPTAARVSRIEYAYSGEGPGYRVVLTPTEGTYDAPPAAPVRKPMPAGLWEDAVASLGQLPPKETATCAPGAGSSSIRAYAGNDVVRDASASCNPDARARIDGVASRWTEALSR
ncbi:hypothetical protein [Mariniluteicoccus flavus]